MTTNSTIRYFADTTAPEQHFRLKYAPNRFSAVALPHSAQTPTGGAYSALPDSLAGSGVGTRGREGKTKERGGRKREGEEGEGKGKENGKGDCLYQ